MRQKFKDIPNETKLYIRSLKPDVTQQQLEDIFAEYGETVYSSIREHKRNDNTMKFGFVQFASKDDA